MSLYDLPNFNLPKIKFPKFWRRPVFWIIFSSIFASSFFGFLAGTISGLYLPHFPQIQKLLAREKLADKGYVPQTTQEEAIIQAVKNASPAVVSIIISKDVPVLEEYFANPFDQFQQFFGDQFQIQVPQYRQNGTQKQDIGGGTGFIISQDGLVLTNKHVALDEQADYTAFTNDGKKYPAKVLARDPVQDLAVLKINPEKIIDKDGKLFVRSFPVVTIGDSDKIQIGQTVIAIGNALGEFTNTVSVGVVSGLARTISASGSGSFTETLEDVIQTDAAINKGNSGGPLLNLKGEVIGINAAVAQDAQNIGFAIPVNKAKKDIQQVKGTGKITYAFLGVNYILINEQVKKDNNLPVDYGVWVVADKGAKAIVQGSPAEKAGIQEKDIILEFNSEKITSENSLAKIIQQYNAGDQIALKILRNKEEKILTVTLGERPK